MKLRYSLLYFIIIVFYYEIILKIFTIGNLSTFDVIISFVFSSIIATIIYLICSFFKAIYSHILATFLLGLSAFIFMSQFIYYSFFRTFYSLYSAKNVTQIFDFWKEVGQSIVTNWSILLLFLVPVFLFVVLGRHIISYEVKWPSRIVLIGSIFISYGIGITMIYVNNTGENSAYDLYYQTNSPVLSVQKLGLFTTMRLDMQRLAFGWSPDSPEPLPEPPPSKNTNVKKKDEKIKYNTLDIDFATLVSNEQNDDMKEMHKYFQNVEPTAKNEYTGKYEGYNLIFITAEAFSPYAVRKDVTPTLYKLVHEGYHFTNFYNPLWGVSTSDGEYVACTGLLPKSGVWSFFESGSNDMPFVMGNQLNKLDYKTVAYHNHSYSYYGRDVSHPNMGYDYKGLGNGLEVKETWPESDLEMMEITIDEYINNQPFHAYYMTVSGHMNYSFSGNYIAYKNKKHVENLPYSESAQAYIATQIELDRALKHLLDQLEDAGIADQTLIAISADHYPYGLDHETIDEFAGHHVERNFELYKSPFVLYTKGMEPIKIEKPTSSLDIIPTLSNLLGLPYDSRLLMGRDVFSDSRALVIFQNKSFITEKGRYNSETEEFTPIEEEVDEEYISSISTIINNKFYYSTKILDNDYYNIVITKE